MAAVPSPRARARKLRGSADAGLDALEAARKTADAAHARLAETVAAAEAVIDRLDARAQSAEATAAAAFAALNDRIEQRLAEAEGAAARTGEAPLARLAEAIAAQVAEAEATGDRLRAGLTEALAAAEESYGRLAAQAVAERERAVEPFRMAEWPPAEATEAVTEGLAEARRHMLGFIAGRIRQGLEAQAELMACRSIEDMRSLQSRFLHDAVGEYMNEAGALMRLGGDVAAKAMPRVRPR